jgi:hypothetical protein
MRSTTYLAIACLSLFTACSGRTSTSPTPTTAAPRTVMLTLDGRVYDNVFRPVPGATVDMIDGVPAGLAAITGDSGSFSLGDVTLTPGKTKIRASKDGYATSVDDPANVPPRSGTGIMLWLLTPSVIHPGEYTMSFVADSACDLPPAARTRTYSATITLTPGYVHLPPERQTEFDVALSGASFLVGNDLSPGVALVRVDVAGDYVAFVLDPYSGGLGEITERLAPATHLELTGSVAGSVGASGASSLPFDGTFTYCVKQSDTGPNSCGPNDPVYTSCHSKNHRVSLTRR